MTGPVTMSHDSAEQLVLGLEHRPALGRDDFMLSPSSEVAVRMLEDWRGWPGGRLALVGPARSGKSHLAALWRACAGADLVAAEALPGADAERLACGPLVIEDADRLGGLDAPARGEAERTLLHVMNLMAAEGHPLLVTGRTSPAQWPVALPDLASRLGALSVAEIGAPDETVLAALLVKFFTDRQIDVAPAVITYLGRRIERSVEAAERVVAALDRLSLVRQRAVTVSMAAHVLEDERA